MSEPPVVNTSPLIILSRIGAIDFLRLLGDRIFVPTAVVSEVAVYGPDDVSVRAIAAATWLVPVEAPQLPEGMGHPNLGAGEAAVLMWASTHPGTAAVLDDGIARRHATVLGIPTVGTLGLILAAKEARVITTAGPVIEQAMRAGLYLSESLVRQSLRRVGE